MALNRAPPAQDAGPTRRARTILVAIALVVVLVVAAVTWRAIDGGDGGDSASAGCPGTPRSAAGPPGVVGVGDVAPDFTLTSLDCKPVKLTDFRGTPVIVNFWASYCIPCRREFPLLRSTDQHAGGEFEVLGVNNDTLSSDGRQFADDEQATWVNAFDANGDVAKSYGVRGLPYTFFIDAKGIVTGVSLSELTRSGLDKQIATMTAAS